MNRKIAFAILNIAATTSLCTNGIALAEIEANLGMVSNYVDRGYTYSNEKPAAQGGIGYTHISGIYLSTWLSTIDIDDAAGVEFNYYAGYSGEIKTFGYEAGYAISSNTDSKIFGNDYREFYLNTSYNIFSAGVYRGNQADVSDSDYTYMELGANFDNMPYQTNFKLHAGHLVYSEANTSSVSDFSLGLNRNFADFTFSLNYAVQYRDEGNYGWLGISRDFEF